MRELKIRSVSSEAVSKLGKATKRVIYSRFTVDRYDCECKAREKDLLNQLNLLPDKQKQAFIEAQTPIECPRKGGKKKYYLICPDCKEIVAVVHALDEHLTEWANLHYISWHNKKSWYGTYGVNINPYTLRVNIECCCGGILDIKSYLVKEVE